MKGQGKGSTKAQPLTPEPENRTIQGPAAQLCSHPLNIHSSALCPQIPFARLGQRGIYAEGKVQRSPSDRLEGHSGPSWTLCWAGLCTASLPA